MSTIGKLARDAGCTVSLIRHYEREGLMPEPARTEGNQRRYGDAHRRRLLFIRHARELGFNLSDIRSLLGMATDPGASCAEVDALARQHLARVEERIGRLQNMQRELSRVIAECGAGEIGQCRIIEALSDHSLCDHQHAEPDEVFR